MWFAHSLGCQWKAAGFYGPSRTIRTQEALDGNDKRVWLSRSILTADRLPSNQALPRSHYEDMVDFVGFSEPHICIQWARVLQAGRLPIALEG